MREPLAMQQEVQDEAPAARSGSFGGTALCLIFLLALIAGGWWMVAPREQETSGILVSIELESRWNGTDVRLELEDGRVLILRGARGIIGRTGEPCLIRYTSDGRLIGIEALNTWKGN